MTQPSVLTPEELADELRISIQATYRALRSGRIPGHQPTGPGGPWRIHRDDIPLLAPRDPMPKARKHASVRARVAAMRGE